MKTNIFTNRTYYRLFFIFYVFTNSLALGYFGITINPLGYIAIIWGCILLLYELWKKQLLFAKNHLLLIVLYGCLLLLATMRNTAFSTTNSFVVAFVQLCIFIFMFGNKKDTTLKTIKQELRIIIPFTSLLVGAASFVSLGMYVCNIYSYRNGWPLGLVGGRLFGIYFNCNPASFLAIVVIIMSMYAIKNKYKHINLFYANIAIQLLYVILTKCRAAIIILAIILVMAVYYKLFRAKEISKLKRMGLSIALCFAALTGSYFIQEGLSIIPRLQGAYFQSGSRFQIEKIEKIVQLIHRGSVDDLKEIINLVDQISSGRFDLTKSAVKVWEKEPLNGIGAYNFRAMLLSDPSTAHSGRGTQILHSHNVFLETLVTSGILGFLVFFCFFVKSSLMMRDVLIKYRNKESYFIILLFEMIVISEFIGGFFDFGVFYNFSLSATLAWMFLGYLYWLNDHHDYELVNTSKDYEFLSYNLTSVSYKNQDKEEINALKWEIINRTLTNKEYCVTIALKMNTSIFQYEIYYALLNEHLTQDTLQAYDPMFAKELTMMVKEEILDLIN